MTENEWELFFIRLVDCLSHNEEIDKIRKMSRIERYCFISEMLEQDHPRGKEE